MMLYHNCCSPSVTTEPATRPQCDPSSDLWALLCWAVLPATQSSL